MEDTEIHAASQEPPEIRRCAHKRNLIGASVIPIGIVGESVLIGAPLCAATV
jgi:hypothetical protein